MYILSQRFVAIILLSSLSLQSCSESRNSGALRMGCSWSRHSGAPGIVGSESPEPAGAPADTSSLTTAPLNSTASSTAAVMALSPAPEQGLTDAARAQEDIERPAATSSASLRELRHTPSPYECAVLSAHVYEKDLKKGESVEVVVHNEGKKTKYPLEDWTVKKIFQESHGYQGVLYVNHKKRQMVLAHRGTDNLGAIKTDLLSIVLKFTAAGQEKLILKVLRSAQEELEKVVKEKGENYSFAVTGHSLGGWLAQITAFLAKADKTCSSKIHVKAITFDTPGARPMLEQIKPKYDWVEPDKLDKLDITNYLSSPNPINAYNSHVGTLYRVVFGEFSAVPIQYTLKSHTINNFLNAFDPTTDQERECVSVKSWPEVSGDVLKGGGMLGQYSGFFKLARETNKYHPDGLNLTEEDSAENEFKLKYKYHYNTGPFERYKLPRRQIPAPAYYFMKNVAPQREKVLEIDWAAIDSLDFHWESYEESVLFTPSKEDIRPKLDELFKIASRYPELCAKETPVIPSAPNQRVARMHMPLAPPPIAFFVGRETLLERLSEAYQHKTGRIVQLLTGLGGIGKTQLALSLYRTVQEKKEYPHTFWLSAESEETLKSGYLGIADMLNININIDIDKQRIDKTIQKVRMRLADKKKPCFYVFDNAPDLKTIEAFLPLQHGHVLITSKNSAPDAWEHGTQRVSVTSFAKPEVIALAAEFSFPLDFHKDKKTLDYLVENMSGYPLALAQFFSLCKVQGYSPADRVKELQNLLLPEQDKELLLFLKENPPGNIQYNKSIFQVLRMSLKHLSQEKYGASAIKLLSLLAYLDPKGIPIDWALTFLPEDSSLMKQETRKALALLEQYSLVEWDRERKQVYIHEVTQQVIRHRHPQESLAALVNHLISYVGPKEQAYQNLAVWSSLLPHGRALFKNIDPTRFPEEGYLLTKYLAEACHLTSLFEEGKNRAEKCLSIARERYPDQNHPDVAASLNNVGSAYSMLSETSKGLEYYEKALAMRQKLYGEKAHTNLAASFNNVGLAYHTLGETSKGLRYLENALEMRQKLYGEKAHTNLAASFNNVGLAYKTLGETRKGLEYFEKALAMHKELYGEKAHPDLAASLNNVGSAYHTLGETRKGLEYYEKALAMRKELYREKAHHNLASSLNNVGSAYHTLGETSKGLEYFDKALAMHKELYGEKAHPALATSLNNVGSAYEALKKYAIARKCYVEGLEISKRLDAERARYVQLFTQKLEACQEVPRSSK